MIKAWSIGKMQRVAFIGQLLRVFISNVGEVFPNTAIALISFSLIQMTKEVWRENIAGMASLELGLNLFVIQVGFAGSNFWQTGIKLLIPV